MRSKFIFNYRGVSGLGAAALALSVVSSTGLSVAYSTAAKADNVAVDNAVAGDCEEGIGDASATDDSVAIGCNADADDKSTAIGNNTDATDRSTAVGNTASADDSSVAVGNSADAFENSVAIGRGAEADDRNNPDDEDSGSVAIGRNSFGRDESVAVGYEADARDESVAIGDSSDAFDESVAVGDDSDATDQSVAVGNNSEADDDSVAVGDRSFAKDESVAVGQNASADDDSVAIGEDSEADDNSVAVGQDAKAANKSIAIGEDAEANEENSAAFGNNVTASRANQMSIGNTDNTYTFSGLTSNASRAAQSGPLEVVTTDAFGNVASDGGEIFRRLDEHEAGVALAISMENPDLVGNERFGIAANWGHYEGANAFSASMIGVLGHNVFSTGDRVAVSGGIGVGFENGRGDTTVGGRAGVQWTFGN